MKVVFLFVCFILGRTAAASFSACHNNHTVSQKTLAVFLEEQRGRPSFKSLYSWCQSDESCSSAYYLDDRTGHADERHRFDAFRYLTTRWLGQEETTGDLLQRELCSHESLSDVAKKFWLLELRAKAYDNVHQRCASNERFIFWAHTMEGHCVCLGNRNCDASLQSNTADAALSKRLSSQTRDADLPAVAESSMNHSAIAIVITSVLVSFLALGAVVETYWKIRAYYKIERSPRDTKFLQRKFTGATAGRPPARVSL